MLKAVKIVAGNPPSAHPDTVTISKADGDRVQWEADSDDWAVVFEGQTPFERDYFEPSHPGSKGIRVAPGNKHYKYTVYLGGKKGADPIVVVT